MLFCYTRHFQTTSNIPVQVSIKSTVQTPAMGIYCWVMILIISCATKPPRNAAELGRSAVGDRALKVIQGVNQNATKVTTYISAAV